MTHLNHALVLASMAILFGARIGCAQSAPPELRARMDAFIVALREMEPMERIASFFPRRGDWVFIRNPANHADGARQGRWRFGPEHTLAAIRESGEICGSFGGVSGYAGPFEGVLVAQAQGSEPRWRYVGGHRFVPPRAGARSGIFVEWVREDSSWVITAAAEAAPSTQQARPDPGRRPRQNEIVRVHAWRHASENAREKTWYVENELVGYRGRAFVKYGAQGALRPDQIEALGLLDGVPFYVETGTADSPEVVYALVSPGVFQAYMGFGHSICRD